MTVVTHANRGLVQALAGDDLNLISEPSLSEIRHVGWITVPALFLTTTRSSARHLSGTAFASCPFRVLAVLRLSNSGYLAIRLLFAGLRLRLGIARYSQGKCSLRREFLRQPSPQL
jgi:hypothetical protein